MKMGNTYEITIEHNPCHSGNWYWRVDFGASKVEYGYAWFRWGAKRKAQRAARKYDAPAKPKSERKNEHYNYTVGPGM